MNHFRGGWECTSGPVLLPAESTLQALLLSNAVCRNSAEIVKDLHILDCTYTCANTTLLSRPPTHSYAFRPPRAAGMTTQQT